MPLNPAGLQSALAGFFAAPPLVMAGDDVDVSGSRAACAQEWATALQSYAAAIVPASSTVAAAAAALSGALAGAFASPNAAAPFDAALLTFATTVGGGMAGFTPVPPAAPLGIATLLGTTQASHAAAAAAWASHIDAWMRTGTAAPLPAGPPAPWA